MGGRGADSGIKSATGNRVAFMPDWFFKKIKGENRNIHLYEQGGEIVRETEKAVLITVPYTTIDGEYDGVKKIWIPKSVALDKKGWDKSIKSGKQNYEKMLDYARAHGVRVRKGMKKNTILKKIKESGLNFEQ